VMQTGLGGGGSEQAVLLEIKAPTGKSEWGELKDDLSAHGKKSHGGKAK